MIAIRKSRRIMQSVADGHRDACRHAGRRPEELQRETWSLKDRRTSQARAIVERTSIKWNKDLYCIEGDDLHPGAMCSEELQAS